MNQIWSDSVFIQDLPCININVKCQAFYQCANKLFDINVCHNNINYLQHITEQFIETGAGKQKKKNTIFNREN